MDQTQPQGPSKNAEQVVTNDIDYIIRQADRLNCQNGSSRGAEKAAHS